MGDSLKRSAAKHARIIKGITDSLKQCPHNNLRLETQQILGKAFARNGFCLDTFLAKLSLPKDVQDRFLSNLLYGIYYNEISPLLYPNEPEKTRWLLLQILAEQVEMATLQDSILSLSWKEQLSLLLFCAERTREGAYKIFELFRINDEVDPAIKHIGIGLQNCYYYVSESAGLFSLDSPADVYNLLEESALKRVVSIRQALPKVIAAIISAPMKGFEALHPFKELDPEEEPDSIKEQRLIIEQVQKQLFEMFLPYVQNVYKEEELQEFFRLYGLYGHVGEGFEQFGGSSPLDEELNMIQSIFENAGFTPFNMVQPLVHFVNSLCSALDAFCYHPERYIPGINRMVYAVPTTGDQLDSKLWLSSVVEGLEALTSFLNRNGTQLVNLASIPIVLFDQSTGKQWENNVKYVNGLVFGRGVTVWHLSSKETVALAKKLGLDTWIPMNSKGAFGYGVSRNAVMFLAPVLHAATKLGITSFYDLMGLSDGQLKAMYEEATLGKHEKDAIISMGDDDIFVPKANFFSDPLFASMHDKEYFSRYSMYIGRATSLVHVRVDSKLIGKSPLYLFESTGWTNQPHVGAMKGKLTKPTFCLPIPFGSEEAHVFTTKSYPANFERPVVHLSGTRFPKELFPKGPYEEISKYLESYVPYAFGIILVQALIDPGNKMERLILPWNSAEMKYPNGDINNLGDLLAFAKEEFRKQSVERSFWNNVVANFIKDKRNSSIRRFCRRFIKYSGNEAFPQNLVEYYQRSAVDATIALEYGELVSKLYLKGESDFLGKARKQIESEHAQKISNLPLTSSLDAMFRFGGSLNPVPLKSEKGLHTH